MHTKVKKGGKWLQVAQTEVLVKCFSTVVVCADPIDLSTQTQASRFDPWWFFKVDIGWTQTGSNQL